MQGKYYNTPSMFLSLKSTEHFAISDFHQHEKLKKQKTLGARWHHLRWLVQQATVSVAEGGREGDDGWWRCGGGGPKNARWPGHDADHSPWGWKRLHKGPVSPDTKGGGHPARTLGSIQITSRLAPTPHIASFWKTCNVPSLKSSINSFQVQETAWKARSIRSKRKRLSLNSLIASFQAQETLHENLNQFVLRARDLAWNVGSIRCTCKRFSLKSWINCCTCKRFSLKSWINLF